MQVLFMMSKSVQQANGVFIAHAIQATPMCTVGMLWGKGEEGAPNLLHTLMFLISGFLISESAPVC